MWQGIQLYFSSDVDSELNLLFFSLVFSSIVHPRAVLRLDIQEFDMITGWNWMNKWRDPTTAIVDALCSSPDSAPTEQQCAVASQSWTWQRNQWGYIIGSQLLPRERLLWSCRNMVLPMHEEHTGSTKHRALLGQRRGKTRNIRTITNRYLISGIQIWRWKAYPWLVWLINPWL